MTTAADKMAEACGRLQSLAADLHGREPDTIDGMFEVIDLLSAQPASTEGGEVVEEAMRLTDECVAAAAREGYMPGGYLAACAVLRSFLSSNLSAPAPAHGWRPIEEAPKDGREFWCFNGEQVRMRWIQGEGYGLWVYADELLCDADPDPQQPTHFMELPEAPK